eukprot:g28574.t1
MSSEVIAKTLICAALVSFGSWYVYEPYLFYQHPVGMMVGCLVSGCGLHVDRSSELAALCILCSGACGFKVAVAVFYAAVLLCLARRLWPARCTRCWLWVASCRRFVLSAVAVASMSAVLCRAQAAAVAFALLVLCLAVSRQRQRAALVPRLAVSRQRQRAACPTRCSPPWHSRHMLTVACMLYAFYAVWRGKEDKGKPHFWLVNDAKVSCQKLD